MPNIPTEHAEQAAVVRWLRARKINFFSVPNGAHVSPKYRALLKAEGLTPGVADLIILDPPTCGGGHVVALELKRRSGGHLSPAQRDWRDRLEQYPHWRYCVALGAAEAIRILTEMGYDKTNP